MEGVRAALFDAVSGLYQWATRDYYAAAAAAAPQAQAQAQASVVSAQRDEADMLQIEATVVTLFEQMSAALS